MAWLTWRQHRLQLAVAAGALAALAVAALASGLPLLGAYHRDALALGVLAGLVLRRTIPALTVTLLVFFATRLAVTRFVRPHFLSPLHAKLTGIDASPDPRTWVLSNSLVDAVGRRISTGREDLA